MIFDKSNQFLAWWFTGKQQLPLGIYFCEFFYMYVQEKRYAIRAQFYTTMSFENLFLQPQVFQSNAYCYKLVRNFYLYTAIIIHYGFVHWLNNFWKFCIQAMSPPRANPAGRARPISAQVKPKNTIITRSNSADKLLQVTSARMVSLFLHTLLRTWLCTCH